MPISDRWGAMAMVLTSSWWLDAGACLVPALLPWTAVSSARRPTHSSGAVSQDACASGLPPVPPHLASEGDQTRLTTIYSGRPLPETRDAVSLQHCSYALVNQCRLASPQVTDCSR